MMSLDSEGLILLGILLMVSALIFLLIHILIFLFSGRRLKKHLEEEYGSYINRKK